jgi:hypothetical protein
MTFVVEPIAPWAATEGASGVTRTTAELLGLVDPLGGGVRSCAFEVGASTAYSQSIECGFVEEAITAFPPAANAAIPVFVRIFGLAPGTTYHFRVAVLGEGGAAHGRDATFTTQPPFSFDERPPQPSSTRPPNAVPPGVAASTVAGLVSDQRTVPGHRDTIASVLRRGMFSMPFVAPEAGTLAVAWYHGGTAPGSHSARTNGRALAASGRFTFAGASRHVVAIRLTPYGRQFLARSMRAQLTATCIFTPVGGQPVRVSRSFDLAR